MGMCNVYRKQISKYSYITDISWFLSNRIHFYDTIYYKKVILRNNLEPFKNDVSKPVNTFLTK